MYNEQNTILPNGKEAIFGPYKKNKSSKNEKEYILLNEFANMDDALNSTCIEGIPFRQVIMGDDT